MINLSSQLVRGRLSRALKSSKEAMEPFRVTHKELVRDYVGSWYGEGSGARYDTLVNLINQTARIYTVALASNNPRVKVSTTNLANLDFARRLQVNINQMIADMNLNRTLRAIVLDAFFCLGCAVVMMRDTDTRYHGLLESEEDVWLDPGEPWINRVSIHDLVLDMSAKEISKMRFCGHRYRADYEKVKSEPGYDKSVVKNLKPGSKRLVDGADHANEIGSPDVQDDELKPMIWLMDLWIPENNSIATFAIDTNLDLPYPPLIERDWEGWQGGPYKFLNLGLVPDNIIPVSPAMNLKMLHDLQNRLHRRMRDDSDAHRRINTYSPGHEDEANLLREAKRNAWIKMKAPDSVTQVELGGISSQDQAFSLFIQEEYDRFAGNLRAMGGLGSQAETAKQEEMIQGGVSRMEADMQQAVVEFAAECCTDLAYLIWNDNNIVIHSSDEIGNTGLYVDSSLEPEHRAGDFEDYKFVVEPYSMVHKTPQQKLQELFSILERIAPLWPMFQASGAVLDAQELLKIIADLQDRPEILRIISFVNQEGAPQGGGSHGASQSPVTTRNVVRRNVPTGGTSENRSNILQQVLSGQSAPQVNSQQAASIGRSPA